MRRATKWTFGLLLLSAFVLPVLGQAQPTVDGDLTDGPYVPVGGNVDAADGFGANDIDSLLVYADDANETLYVAVAGTLTTGNGIAIWLNATGRADAPSGAPAGTSLGLDRRTNFHYLSGNQTGENLGFQADFEVDVATAIGATGADETTAYLADYTGASPTVAALDTTDQQGTAGRQGDIAFAFSNSDAALTGAEWKIPYSAIGAPAGSEFEVFAVITNENGYFSNETIPGDATQLTAAQTPSFDDSNPGPNPQWDEFPGGPYHDRPGDQPPVASADRFTVKAGQTLDVPAPGVLGNDGDPERDALSAALVEDVSSGSLTLNADGSFEYTADPSFSGDSFRYEALDSGGNADTATVEIDVNNPPTARPDSVVAEGGQTLSIAAPGVLENDTDPEGDSLSTALVSDVSNGSLSLNADGSFEYTANSGFPGDSFRYEALDPGGGADTATVDININQAPTARADSFTARSGRSQTIATPGVLGNDGDPEGGELTASLVEGVSNGSLSLQADGSFEYTANADFTGTDRFRYEATDPFGVSDTTTATIEVLSPDTVLVDGRIDDPRYQLLGTSADAADGFSEGNDLDALFVYPDDETNTLYVAAAGTLQTIVGNGYGIWVNATGPNAASGAPAGTDLGLDRSTNFHHLSGDQNGTNTGFQADFEVDLATAIAPVTTDSSSTTVSYLADYTGASPTVAALDTTDLKGTPGRSGDIEFALLNSNADRTGAEWKIPYSAIGATDDSEFEVFGVIVSSTGFFSNETIPGDGTQLPGINAGNNAQWDAFPGGPYHDKLGNQPPVAVDDSFKAELDTTLRVPAPGVLFNDGDPDDDPVSVALVSDVSNGNLTLNADGSFNYEPNADFLGTDRFTYEVTAGGDADTATTTLDVRLPPPTNLATSLSGDSIRVTWSPPSAGTVDRYRLYRDTASIDPASGPAAYVPDTTLSGEITTYIDTNVVADTTYFYRVAAVDAQGQASAFSPEVRRLFDVPSASATEMVSADGTVEFDDTGTTLSFSGVSGSGGVTVNRFDGSPSDTVGIDKKNVSSYRVTIEAGGNLQFDSTDVQFAVSSLRGVDDPGAVTIYKRDRDGTGSFTALNTRVGNAGTPDNASDDTLYATTGSFSEFAFASDTEPLPVELVQFAGTLTDGGVQLRWRTASEQNNAGFRVLRRRAEEAGAWTSVGFVESGAAGGTTSTPSSYRFTDAELPFEADSVRYRLKQVDLDGTTTYSDPITIDRSAVETLRLKAPYPNPAQGHVVVPFAVPENADGSAVHMRLYDVLGRRVRTVRSSAEPGRHEQKLEVTGLANGVYFLRLRVGDTAKTRKITVLR